MLFRSATISTSRRRSSTTPRRSSTWFRSRNSSSVPTPTITTTTSDRKSTRLNSSHSLHDALPICHYQYEQKKKQHDAKKKQHVVQVKELKFRPNTDDHDYDFKMNHAIRFLGEGNRVKAVVQFRGREIAHADLGKKLLIRFAGDLAAHGTVEGQPRMEGRNAHILISPVKAATKPAGEKPPKPSAPPPPQS